jgi:hypothetical protein
MPQSIDAKAPHTEFTTTDLATAEEAVTAILRLATSRTAPDRSRWEVPSLIDE